MAGILTRLGQRLRELGVGSDFLIVSTLFFFWGFVTATNNPLVAAVRDAFHLGYAEALMTQIVFFAATGLVALPAAMVEQRVGTVKALTGSLTVIAVGCLLVLAALPWKLFWALLAALFVIGCGVTALQVAANPLAVRIGPAQSGHFRLTFAQGLNSIGVVAGVHFGSLFLFGGTGPVGGLAVVDGAGTIYACFLAMAVALVALVIFARHRIPAPLAASVAAHPLAVLVAGFRSRTVMLGAGAIALYVGAEVAIASIMIDFLGNDRILAVPFAEGGWFLANIYWGGALFGRFVGSALLVRIRAARLLTICALCATIACGIVVASEGPIAAVAALSIGLFNSIMFPTIFSLTLERSDLPETTTSGFLCVAIMAGAIIPLVMGVVADRANLSLAFAIPLLAYALIAAFAAAKRRKPANEFLGMVAEEEHIANI